MMASERAIADEVIRTDFAAFILWAYSILYPGKRLLINWHIVLLADYFEDLRLGRRRRLLICMPPRHLKSFIGSACFPAWILGHEPGVKIVCISYSQDLADEFAHQFRILLESSEYRRIFPKTRIDPGRSKKSNIGTTRNGHRRATSITGAVTGLGGDYLIIDDAIKADDVFSEVVRERVNSWFDTTLQSRLDDPKTGRIIIIAQRLHVDDLPGRMIARGGWDLLNLPMIAWEKQRFETRDSLIVRPPGDILHEERMGEEEIRQIQSTLPSWLFEAQYNQRPVQAGGNLFKLEWLQYTEQPVDPRSCDYVLQSWDTASQISSTNDYSVCVTVGLRGSDIHILDIYRDRIEFPDQVKRVPILRKQWGTDLVMVEGSIGGLNLYQQVCRDHDRCRWIITFTPKGSKEERAEGQTVKFEKRRVFIPRHALWRLSFESELAVPERKA
jgi:hypothetical protein